MVARREQFANRSVTSLSSGINNSVTSVTVADGSGMPSSGDFRIAIGSEIMIVTARSSNTLTVQRGKDGTSARQHDAGEWVYPLLTRDALKRVLVDFGQVDTEALFWTTPLRLHTDGGTILDSSDFAWINQGTSTVQDDTWGGLTMFAQSVATPHSLRILKKSQPSTPYIITSRVMFGASPETGVTGTLLGVGWRQSSDGKLITAMIRPQDKQGVWTWNSPTSWAGGETTVPFYGSKSSWIRLDNDGSDLTAYFSQDGLEWFQVWTQAVGTFMTPDEVGFIFGNYQLNGEPGHLLAWYEH